jgi:uncharacterized hydrophobic protein (TIGR00271 family)
MGIVKNIIDDNRFTPEDLPKLEEKLFWEGPQKRISLERFAMLLLLSTIIATYGVLKDSTATVIGAMIIAPLMVPIVATAAALVMGDLNRAGKALMVVVVGVTGVVLVAFVCGVIHPIFISFTTNSQITGRVSPSLGDLIVALASGVAGAFAVSRDDVADSLPGVAISISLVPPLAVSGISLSHGEFLAASGSFLLFITNFFSILLAGGLTFVFLGLSLASTQDLTRSIRRKAFITIIIGTLLVAIPLSLSSFRVARDSHLEYKAQKIARKWLEQSNFDLIKLDAHADRLEMVITGSGPPPSLSDFSESLDDEFDRDITTQLKVISSQIKFYPTRRSE